MGVLDLAALPASCRRGRLFAKLPFLPRIGYDAEQTGRNYMTAGVVKLDYAVPPADLAEFVTVFYEFTADVPVFRDAERADHAQARFLLSGGPGHYRFVDGTEQEACAVQIIGPTTGNTQVEVEGPVWVFGCGLQPAGWSALMGVDASSLANRRVDATELFGPGALAAAALLRAAPDLAARIAITADLARQLLGQVDHARFAFARAVDAWLSSSVSPEVEDLEARAGLSRRQLERQCKRLYGAPPKMLARKYRALRAAHALANGCDPGDLLGWGFYDQSHLIREVKQFTGVTPRQMQAEPGLLAQLTIQGRTQLAGQVPVLVSDT